MAQSEYFVTVPGRYGTRMLQAGDRLALSAPHARTLLALGRITAERPAKKLTADAELNEQLEAAIPSKPARKKAAPRRKKT